MIGCVDLFFWKSSLFVDVLFYKVRCNESLF